MQFSSLLKTTPVTFTVLVYTVIIPPVNAQIIPDKTLGNENSTVIFNPTIRGTPSDRIDGGAVRGNNLFHSFQEFNVDVGRGAYFSNPEGIQNILTRVTGKNPSNILGVLGVLGNANLFLINPNGIVFGPNARLDVGGSFFATTADGILFENGVEFAASNPQAPPLLTINMPVGINIRSNPRPIINQAKTSPPPTNFNGNPLTTNQAGLYVLPQKTIALIGGEIQFESGVISSPGSRVELGGLSEAGILELTPDNHLIFPLNVQRSDISLTNGAVTQVIGNPGGNIALNVRNLEISQGSQIINGVAGALNLLSVEPQQNLNFNLELLQAGEIQINATESITLNQNSLIGNAGKIEIQTPVLTVNSGSQILTATLGIGEPGNLTITAGEIEVLGTSTEGISSGITTILLGQNTGNRSTLTLKTQRLLIRDGAQVLAANLTQGDGGELTVTATEIELVGTSADGQFPSAITTVSPLPTATGNSGAITINVENLSVRDGAQITTAIFGNGDAGNLSISATNIALIGTSTDGQFPSSITTVSLGQQSGNSGSVSIDTQRLLIQDGAQVSTATFGQGDAGNLTITATDIELVGTPPRGLPSGITASVGLGLSRNQEGGGNGRAVPIDPERLSVQGGTLRVLAAVFGERNGENLIAIGGVNTPTPGLPNNTAVTPGADLSGTPEVIGKGGTLTVNTDSLLLQDGAQISVSAFGQGSAGNLEIDSQFILLDNQAALSAETSAGDSGNITLNSEEIQLRRNSPISTNATGESTGGGISINTDRLIALENSDITANAQQAFGGQIAINANAVLGTRIRQQPTPASDITASSELGTQFSGTIDFNSEFDSSGFAVEFSQEVVDPEAIIAENPCRENQESQFIITGRGGLPPNPTQETINPAVRVGLSDQIPETEQRSVNPIQRRESARKTAEEQPISSLNIVPARGWIRDEKGDIILVGYDPTGTQVRRDNSQSQSCNMISD